MTTPHQPARVPLGPGSPLNISSPQLPPTTTGSSNFELPPSKRQRFSPDIPSQTVQSPTSYAVQSPVTSSVPSPAAYPPQSSTPYQHKSPYAMSPGATTPGSSTASPHFATKNLSLPANSFPNHSTYTTPYGNGQTTPSSLNPTAGSHTPAPAYNSYPHSQQQQVFQANGNMNGQAPNNFHLDFSAAPRNNGAGMMGPPSKPVERDNANDDQMDVLANAGIDLRAEENYSLSYHTGSFNSQPGFSQAGPNQTGHGFTQFLPGDASSLFGAGPANQLAETTDAASQEELLEQFKDQAWDEAARRLADSREIERKNPHVDVKHVWKRMDVIAQEHGLGLRTEAGGRMGEFVDSKTFRKDIQIVQGKGPDGNIAVTNGTWIPADAPLIDQLALISLATNHRLRGLLEDAVAIARNRRINTQGEVPSYWAEVSAPINIGNASIVKEDVMRSGWESATSPMPRPNALATRKALEDPSLTTEDRELKKSLSGFPGVSYSNDTLLLLRESAKEERAHEEERLRKRQERLAGSSSQPTPAVPATPGSIAPEPPTKPLTKKEREKQDRGKQSIADSHAQANATTQQFLFGGGKKGKTYSWMQPGGGAASGTSTPNRSSSQTGAATPTATDAAPEKLKFTAEGTNRLGSFREDKNPGQLVEVRDVLQVLEKDGRNKQTLQVVYANLDNWSRGRKTGS